MARTRPEHSTKKEDFDPDVDGELPFRVLGLLGCVFGAIHCLAWNSPFPTSQERLAWRICSAATVAIPGMIVLVLQCLGSILVCISIFCDAGKFIAGKYFFVQTSVGLAYILGRITLFILALIELRALPTDAFRTVDWTKYFPHFAN